MRKRRPMARALSLLLSLILALSLLPGAALAEGADSTDTGSTKYYCMDDVSEVLELAVRSETTPTAKDYEDYDLDKNGLLTTWDAKRMLDTMPDLTGLALDKDTLTMPVGSKARLNVTYTPDNSYDMRLKWTSSDETVATVQGGVVTALKAGTVTITATAVADSVNPKPTATCTVTVTGTVPTISAKAMQISTKGNGSSEWADLEITGGTLEVIPRTKDSFTKTLGDLCDNNTRYPNAGALLNGKLLLQTSYKAANEVNDIQVQVDPNSFAAPALSKKASDRWYDATTLSNGSLLVVTNKAGSTNYFVTADGKETVWVTVPPTSDFPALRGIASAGKDSSGAEVLYGVTDDGKLYQLTLTSTGDEYTPYALSVAQKVGSVPTSKMIQSASLLYDNTSGYLLVSVSYATDLAAGENAGLFYLIDPKNPGCYFDLPPADGAVFTSLYQHTSSFKNGVYLYVDQTPISLTVGSSVKLPEAEAYAFNTENGLVTNWPIDVSWGSNTKDIVTVDSDKRIITGVKKGPGQIWVSANYNGSVAKYPIPVTVREDTGLAGATVGALVDTGIGNPSWGVIDLGLDDSGNLTFTEKGKADKNYTGGGYAQGKLWGFYSTSTEKTLYPFNAETFTASGDPFTTGKYTVVDLTGAPATTVEYTTDDGKRTVTEDPAPLVFVTSDGLLGLLNGKIRGSFMSGPESLASDYYDNGSTSTYKLSAITYVGDLDANHVREQFSGKSYLENCDGSAACHIYYALAEDEDTGSTTLRQLILVPQVDMKDNTPTLSYTLCGSTIGTVAFTDNTSTTSMDFWTDGNRYGLLVARSKAFEGHSIWYIDLTNYTSSTSGNALSTTELGKLTNVNDSTVNSFSGLYHTENTKLSDTQIYKIAGWIGTSSQSLAEVTLEASLKAVSAEQGASGDAKTVTVDIYSSKPATNGLWALKYDTEKLSGPVVSAENEAILYWSYRHYPKTGIVRVAFAIRGEKGLESDKDNPLFTVTFTVKEGQTANAANDVKITERELNQTLNTGGTTGGNTGGTTGGNSGTVTPSKPETLPFTDVEEGSYCYDAVRWAVEKGVTEGVSETSFAPNDPCTRGQAVTFLWRAAGSPAPESQEMPFTDVAESSPYAKAILWAAENGVTKGVTETTFAPNQPCTRGQIVTFLYRSQGAPAQAGSNPFTDVAEESPYLAGILWAAENGVTKGVTETTFAPNNTCVRGQIVTFLFRLWT